MSRRVVMAAVGLIVVVAGIAVAVVALSRQSSTFTGPTAAQLYAREARFGTFSAFVRGGDPDEFDRSGNNVEDTVTFIGGGRYRLTIQNVGFLGYINTFAWNAPNIEITRVLSSSSGSCTSHLVHSVPTQFGPEPESSLNCTGMAVAPPKCSCEGGGTATVTFLGHPFVTKNHVYYGVVGSRIVLGNMTLVPYHIPSYLGASSQVDLPLCAKGQASSKVHMCVHPT